MVHGGAGKMSTGSGLGAPGSMVVVKFEVIVVVDVLKIVEVDGSITLTPVQFSLSSGGPVTVLRAGTPEPNPEGKGWSDPNGKAEPERVSFTTILIGLPDMVAAGISPLVPRRREELFFSSEAGIEFVGIGLMVSRPDKELLLPSGAGASFVGIVFKVSRLKGELLLPSGAGTTVGRPLVPGSPVPRRIEELPSVTAIETAVDKREGFLGESTGTGAAVAIETSSSLEESAETDEAVENVVTGEMDGESVGVVESLVMFRIAFCRRKRTRMIVSLWFEDTGAGTANILHHLCRRQPRRQQIAPQRMSR